MLALFTGTPNPFFKVAQAGFHSSLPQTAWTKGNCREGLRSEILVPIIFCLQLSPSQCGNNPGTKAKALQPFFVTVPATLYRPISNTPAFSGISLGIDRDLNTSRTWKRRCFVPQEHILNYISQQKDAAQRHLRTNDFEGFNLILKQVNSLADAFPQLQT